MSCEKIIDLRKMGDKWVDMCGSKWVWKNGSPFKFGGGGHIS